MITTNPKDPGLHKTKADGQNESYLVLPDDQRKPELPVRDTYIHLKCNGKTTMGRAIAETYATNPHYYGATYCAVCQAHFPVGKDGEFIWEDGTLVGTYNEVR